ncbi:MAG: YfhO family protein [Chloroflexi bacterium]|nr:YfhO family protein [Chloroflexota bacterium]
MGPGIIQTHAGGDSPFLLQRTYELVAGLRAGAFPVRWMPDAAFGLGYPFFNFYAALPYYLAALLNTAGFDLLTAIKLTQTVGMFATAATMWLYARKHLPKSGALLATIAYVLAPYHLVNLYVRGDSLQEFYAFIWYPLILWAIDQLVEGAGNDEAAGARSAISQRLGALLALAFGLAGLVLTHNVSALIFAPFIVLYALARLLQHARNRQYRRTIALSAWLAGAALLALIISAWFWAPALGESSAVQLNNQTTGYFDYNNHFRTLNLVQPNVVFDYSVDGSLKVFAMALPQAALVMLGVLAWLRYDRRSSTTLIVFLLFALSTLMITPLSRPIWNATAVLPLAQFPWRFLSVQAVFAAMLIGNIARLPWLSIGESPTSTSRPQFSRATAWTSQAVVLILLLLTLPGLPNERLDIRSEDVSPQTLQLYEWFSGNIGSTIRAEYLPATVQPRPVVGPDLLQQPRRALTVGGSISTSALMQQAAASQDWRISITSDVATFTLPLLYWPGWHAEVSSVASGDIPTAPAPIALSPYAGSGWVMLSLPKGDFEMTLRLIGTPLERIAEGVSLAGLVMLVGVAVALLWRSRGQLIRYRRMVVAGATGVLVLALAGQVSRLLYQSAPAPLLTMDYGDRQFVHRSPVTYTSSEGNAYVLTGAEITPASVRAGDVFTLTTTWRDNRAPAEVGIDQELPSGGYFAYLFRFAHSLTFGPAELSHHVAITDALPGPLLLKLVVRDSAGNIYTPTNQNGVALVRPFLAGLTVNEPAEPTRDQVGAPIRTFPNGIVLRTLDWYQPTDHDLCFRPGWESARTLASALQVSFLMRGADGREIARADAQPQAGLEPTWSWPQGALVRDGICVKTTGLLQPGEPYTLLVRWYRVLDQQPDGEVILVGTRAQDTVNAPNLPHPVITNHTYALPAVQHPAAVTFGNNIKLMGYDLVTTTQHLDLTLYWTAISTPALDYKSFVHISPLTSEEPVRQADRYTLDGKYPSGMWMPGEIVSDTVQLDLSGVPPGRYQLAIGWYDPQSLARLPAVTGDTALPDGRYVVTELDRQ